MLPLLKPAVEIAADLRARQYSSRELVEAYLARMDGVGRSLNAVVVRRVAEGLQEAAAADAARAAGFDLGPLAGVPITIKDSFDVAGLPTTFGHTSRAGHRASTDALAVARLKAAGAIVLGKTNVPKDLADWHSFNDVYGVTLNPWNEERTPGGSSGGAAAALAAGLTALELGSDIAGSIRGPAICCGVWGHKPTFGIVPLRGHAMSEDEAPSDILVGGPLARSALDLELALDIVAGADPDDPAAAAWGLRLPPEPRTRAGEFRVAIVEDDRHFPVDGSIRRALSELADALARDGAKVDRAPEMPMPSREALELFITLLRGATSARFSAAEIDALTHKARTFAADDKSYDALMYRGLAQSHRAWLAANDRRHVLRRKWRAFFQRYDALICPEMTTPPFPQMLGVPKMEQFVDVNGAKRPATDNYYWIGLPALSYLPATAIPLGSTPEGLPVGAQIIGPEYGDKRCLRLAQIIERSFRAFKAPARFAALA